MILFLPYIFAGLAALGGLGANWWLDFTDWNTAGVAAVALVACVIVSWTGNSWSRLIVIGILLAAAYLKGGIDKEAALGPKYKAEVDAIHSAHAQATLEEQERQAAANAAAAKAAEQLRVEQDAELEALRKQLAESATAAAQDPDANRPALSLDAVRRINAARLRKRPGS